MNFLNFKVKPKIFIHLFLLVAVVACLVASHLIMAANHFTHYDDLYAPYLMREIFDYTDEKMLVQLTRYGMNKSILEFVFEILGKDAGLILLKYLTAPIAIAKSSTFAPLQFYFTGLLAWIDLDYQSTLFLVRLPSVMFSIVYVMCAAFYLRLINKSESEISVLYFLIFSTTSWMFLVYSSQAENYIIGLVFIPMMLLILHNARYLKFNLNKLLLSSLIVPCGVFSTYQIIWFIPAYVLAYAFQIHRNSLHARMEKIKHIAVIMVVSAISAFLAYVLFIKKLIGEHGYKLGVGWNAGPQGQYHFSDGLNNIAHFPEFIVSNYREVVWAIIAPGNYSEPIISIIIIFFTFFVLVGFFRCHIDSELRYINLFVITTIALWFFSIFVGRLSFSPTRHSLIFISLFWLHASMGAHYFANLSFFGLKGESLVNFYMAALLSLFIIGFSEQYSERANKLIDNNVFKFIQEKRPRYIVTYDYMVDFTFDKDLNNSYSRQWINSYPFYLKFENHNPINNDIYIICASRKDCHSDAAVNKIISDFNIKERLVEVINSDSPKSNTSVCFGNYTNNGVNDVVSRLYIYGWHKRAVEASHSNILRQGN